MFAITFILLTFVISKAEGDTKLRFHQLQRNFFCVYDYESGIEIAGRIRVRHRGEACNFFVTISSGQSGSFNSRSMIVRRGDTALDYQIYDNPNEQNVIKDLASNPNPDQVIDGSFGTSSHWQIFDIRYSLHIPKGQYVPRESYHDTVIAKLHKGTLAESLEMDDEIIEIRCFVRAAVKLSLVNPGQSFDYGDQIFMLDFGLIERGESLGCDVLVRSNIEYSIFLKSENQSVMRHTKPNIKSSVPYTLQFNGHQIDLTNNRHVKVLSRQAPTDIFGLRYPLIITIGEYGVTHAGDYEDVITITAATSR